MNARDLIGALLTGLLGSGCTEDVEEGLVVCIDMEEQESWDALVVTIAFAAGFDGPVCTPGEVTFPPAADPVCIGLKPGPLYGDFAAIRAVSMQGATELARREVTLRFLDGEQLRHDLTIEGGCPPCPEHQHCESTATLEDRDAPDTCLDSPSWEFFGEGSIERDAVPCIPP